MRTGSPGAVPFSRGHLVAWQNTHPVVWQHERHAPTSLSARRRHRSPARPGTVSYLYRRVLSSRPVPSVKVTYRSAAMLTHSSTRPLGQMTRTRGTVVAAPRPTSTRGSWAEA